MAEAYCSNIECEYNENGCACEYEGAIYIDENGYCESFRYKYIEPENKE